MENISVKAARHVQEYQVELSFNDGTRQVIDFGEFLRKHSHPQWNKYRDVNQFKQFAIENGNLVWGENWDLIFPVHQLYQGKIRA